MTTATPDMKTPTTDAVLAALQQARAKMPDADDLVLSPRQLRAHEQRRAQFDAYIRGLQSVTHSSADDLYATRDYLNEMRAAIEKQVNEAPDPATIGDSRERKQEEDRQRWLADSLTALRVGVKLWPNGAPMIPQPLADLLRKTCAACGHTELTWPGCLLAVEEDIVAMEKKMTEERRQLDALLAGAAALLAETNPVEAR